MANTGVRGIDIRQTGTALIFEALLQGSDNAILNTGTAVIRIYEIQSDGTFLSYDFSSNTFKSTALITETLAMSHRKGNNNTTDTGIWTAALTTLSGFTVGAVYIVETICNTATPPVQARKFQYGSGDGDLIVSSTGAASSNLVSILGSALSGTAAYIAAAFSYFFNVTAPAKTINDVGGSGGGSGTGSLPVVFNIKNSSTNANLANATVSAYLNGSLSATGLTDASGNVTLNLDATTYLVSARLAGFNGTSQTFTITGTTGQNMTLAPISITPSPPGTVTGYLYCYDSAGNVESGVVHYLAISGPYTSAGYSFNTTAETATSDVTGLVQFTGIIPTVNYIIQREGGSSAKFVGQSIDFQLPSLTGNT